MQKLSFQRADRFVPQRNNPLNHALKTSPIPLCWLIESLIIIPVRPKNISCQGSATQTCLNIMYIELCTCLYIYIRHVDITCIHIIMIMCAVHIYIYIYDIIDIIWFMFETINQYRSHYPNSVHWPLPIPKKNIAHLQQHRGRRPRRSLALASLHIASVLLHPLWQVYNIVRVCYLKVGEHRVLVWTCFVYYNVIYIYTYIHTYIYIYIHIHIYIHII